VHWANFGSVTAEQMEFGVITHAAAGTSTNYSIFNRESGRVIRWATALFITQLFA
jgi:hypothetical protein